MQYDYNMVSISRLHDSIIKTINSCDNKCDNIGLHLNAILSKYHSEWRKNTSVYKFLENIYDTHPSIINHDKYCDKYDLIRSEISILIKLATMSNCDDELEKLNNHINCNPNISINGQLPLDIAIINNNLKMVKWLILGGAILYTNNDKTTHIPKMHHYSELLPNINNIDNDILEVIIDHGAFGNPLSMLELMYRLYKIDKKNVKLYNLICKLLYRFDIDFWMYHSSFLIHKMLNEFIL